MHLMTCIQLAKYNNFIDIDSHLNFELAHARTQRWDGVSGPPLKKHEAIGFLSNTGPDPIEIIKLPSQQWMLGHHRPANETQFKRRFAGGPMMTRL